jgi:Spy/CpxP family protein refolding chaperone
MQMLFNGITLTAQQQAKVDSIEAVYTPQMRALFTPGQPPDSAARARMTELRNNEDRDLRAVLTPEQQTIFDKNVANMPMMGGPRRGPPGGR